MSDDLQPESGAPEPEASPRAKKSAAKRSSAKKTSAKKAIAGKADAKEAKATAPRKRRVKVEEPTPDAGPVSTVDEVSGAISTAMEDPIGDTTDGEARFLTEPIPDSPEAVATGEAEMEAYRAEVANAAEDGTIPGLVADGGQIQAEEDEPASAGAPRPPKKLERLQKILSQAGIASRRRAEEMIVAGRVMVNGQVVTELGSKADASRDHIRVDGKLLHGAERHRYFMLNKPRGYVTTVSDPEGRPTVMEFLAKLNERLYPVGRLDYQSEGLLLMTNDGELANGLTRAASGVEKTYLVKVAGRPGEAELDKLRGGVTIESEEPGSRKVRTAPARVRQVRHGDNPWYEVVLIEGRNRELRKMFSAVGHFVEKIRRVGYGPLVLDVEPGQLRELEADEVAALRLAAEGKLKPRRVKSAAMLPKEAGRPAEQSGRDRRPGNRHAGKPAAGAGKPFQTRQQTPSRPEWKPRREGFGGQANRGAGRFQRPLPQSKPRIERPGFPEGPRREQDESRPRHDRGESRFERPRDKGPFERRASSGRPQGREAPARFQETGRRPFRGREERPPSTRPEEPNRRFGQRAEAGRRPERGPGRSPGKSFGAGAGKAWAKAPSGRPHRTEGSPGAFRGGDTPGLGGARPASGDRSKRTFGARPGGFTRPEFKNKPHGAKKTGFRPSGGRPGGKKRG